jgi:hypothetical protein
MNVTSAEFAVRAVKMLLCIVYRRPSPSCPLRLLSQSCLCGDLSPSLERSGAR